MKHFIELIISKLKKENFNFDVNLTSSYILKLIFSYLFAMMRGLFNFGKFRCFLFKNVILNGKNKIYLGENVKIGPYTHLDGMSSEGLFIGNNSSISSHCIIKVSGSVSHLGLKINIGNNVGIGDFSHIGGAGGVDIGDDTIIGSYFSVHPENHIFSNVSIPIRLQGIEHKGIKIGSGCWIGAKVTILDGANIGNNCVIAAGAVVRGFFPNNCVIGGVPAKIIKYI